MYSEGTTVENTKCECGGIVSITHSYFLPGEADIYPFHCWCGSCEGRTRLYETREEAIQAWKSGERISLEEAKEEEREWLRVHGVPKQMKMF